VTITARDTVLKEAALCYAAHAWPALPLHTAANGRCSCGSLECSSPGKHPRTEHGLKDATTDTKQVTRWWSQWPDANIGIRTGPTPDGAGVFVLDIDPRHAGDRSLAELICEYGDLPETVEAVTGSGGSHLLFAYPVGDVVIRNTANVRPGIDVRGDGGYIVVEPSVHICGRTYAWKPGRSPHNMQPAEAPAWLLDLLRQKPTTVVSQHVAKPSDGEMVRLLEAAGLYVARADGASEGARNNVAFNLAGHLATFEVEGGGPRLTEGQILDLMRGWNLRNSPPLPEPELEKVVGSAMVNGTPRQVHVVMGPAATSSTTKSGTIANKRKLLCLDQAVRFPLEALPQPIAGFVDSAARAIGCDPSFVALPLLAGLASAVGNTRRIQLKMGWTEPSIVWAANVADSGTLKSPALELALRPIRKRQHSAMRVYTEEMKRFQDELLHWEKNMAAWKRSQDGDDPPAKPVEPKADRCWCDDTTMEALAVLLLQNWRGLLLVRDELSGWLRSFDRYSQGKGADAAKWLEMFGGRSMMVDRKSSLSKTIYVPRAAVSVVGSIQPEILRRALGVEHRENGLAARLLLACPPRQPKCWTEADITPDMENRIEAVFDKLYSLEPMIDEEGEAQPVIVPLSVDGKAAWVDFYNEHAQEQAELTGDLAAAWSKLECYAARLALVIHFVRCAAGDSSLATGSQIDATSVKAGVQLSQWFGNEARRVYAILGESDEQRDQRRLIELIQRKGGSVTVRDLMRSARMFPDADVAKQTLDELDKAGYGHWEDPPIGQTGGRPTRRFVLAPGVDTDTTLDSSTVSGVVSTSAVSTGTDYSDEQEERAAILEYDGTLLREAAEERAFRSEKEV